LLPAIAGTVTVNGETMRDWSWRERALVFGYVPQAQLGLFPFTVREMVLMGRTAHVGLFGGPTRRDRDAAAAALALLGIIHLADRPYTQVSGGERQLTLIARALAQEPDILVLDEPTASLDFGNQVRVLTQVRTLAEQGIAVILSTHDPDQAFLTGDPAALLHGGRVTRLGPPDEVLTPTSLREAYGVEVEVKELMRADGRRVRVCIPRLGEAGRAMA
jgi:iron complex transport system ATP-binding protein